MKNKTIRIIGNNFILLVLEVIWFYLGYLGIFNFLIRSDNAAELALGIDFRFLILSQLIIIIGSTLLTGIGINKEKVKIKEYYILSNISLLGILSFFAVQFYLNWGISAIILVCLIIIIALTVIVKEYIINKSREKVQKTNKKNSKKKK